MTAPISVAFLGLGRLGGPMARRLAAAGHDVRGVDPSSLATDAAAAGGVVVAADAAAAAAGATVACVMVRDDVQAHAVVLGPTGVVATLAAGATVVVHSTVSLATIDDLAAACASAELGFVDAGISGGPERADDGTLVAVCGGDPAVLDAVRPLLAAYASDVIHCGPIGAGMAAKLARNLSQYGVWAALFEGMEVAERAGVDLATYARYVRLSGLPTNHDVVLGRTSTGPVATGGDEGRAKHLRWAVELGYKDLDDAFELADRLGVAIPIGVEARRRYAEILGWDGTIAG